MRFFQGFEKIRMLFSALLLYYVNCAAITREQSIRIYRPTADLSEDAMHRSRLSIQHRYNSSWADPLAKRDTMPKTFNGHDYVVDVEVAGKTFAVLVDYSSSDFWVVGEQSKATSDSVNVHKKRTKFDPKKAKDYESTGKSVSLEYPAPFGFGTRSVLLKTYRGDVSLAGKTSHFQDFGVSYHQSYGIGSASGVIGFGLFTGPCKICRAVNFARPLLRGLGFTQFNLHLKKGVHDGTITLGQAKRGSYVGVMNVERVSSEDHWAVYARSIGFSDYPPFYMRDDMVIDPNGSGIFLKKIVSDFLAKSVGAEWTGRNGIYSIPCDVANTGHTLELELSSGHNYFIPPDSYVIQTSDTTCMFGIMANTYDYDANVLGSIFLENYYAHFDNTAHTVSFAMAVKTGCCDEIQGGCCPNNCECCKGLEMTECKTSEDP